MNRVILIGRFTRDPESRMGANNNEVARFSLACSNEFVNRDGQRDTEFINCVAFGKTANTINRYCRKGQLISGTGRIKNSSYDAQDGSKRYSTDVIIDQFEFLGSNKDNSSNGGNNSSYNPVDNNFNNNFNNNYNESPMSDNTSNIETTDVSEDPYKDFGEEINISSDDLPF